MEKIYLIIAIAFAISTTYLLATNHVLRYKKIYNDIEMEELRIDLADKQERLTNYTLTSIELNNICDQFQSSRKAKSENKKLQELLNELN
jgi:hypothetical protein